MKLQKTKKALVLVGLFSTIGLGCELIVDFDRTKIPVEEVPETGGPDAPEVDTGTGGDTGAPDATQDAPTTNDAGDAGDASDAPADG